MHAHEARSGRRVILTARHAVQRWRCVFIRFACDFIRESMAWERNVAIITIFLKKTCTRIGRVFPALGMASSSVCPHARTYTKLHGAIRGRPAEYLCGTQCKVQFLRHGTGKSANRSSSAQIQRKFILQSKPTHCGARQWLLFRCEMCRVPIQEKMLLRKIRASTAETKNHGCPKKWGSNVGSFASGSVCMPRTDVLSRKSRGHCENQAKSTRMCTELHAWDGMPRIAADMSQKPTALFDSQKTLAACIRCDSMLLRRRAHMRAATMPATPRILGICPGLWW